MSVKSWTTMRSLLSNRGASAGLKRGLPSFEHLDQTTLQLLSFPASFELFSCFSMLCVKVPKYPPTSVICIPFVPSRSTPCPPHAISRVILEFSFRNWVQSFQLMFDVTVATTILTAAQDMSIVETSPKPVVDQLAAMPHHSRLNLNCPCVYHPPLMHEPAIHQKIPKLLHLLMNFITQHLSPPQVGKTCLT
jgi:hypothetical protein